jgi:hypothetical protein
MQITLLNSCAAASFQGHCSAELFNDDGISNLMLFYVSLLF